MIIGYEYEGNDEHIPNIHRKALGSCDSSVITPVPANARYMSTIGEYIPAARANAVPGELIRASRASATRHPSASTSQLYHVLSSIETLYTWVPGCKVQSILGPSLRAHVRNRSDRIKMCIMKSFSKYINQSPSVPSTTASRVFRLRLGWEDQ